MANKFSSLIFTEEGKDVMTKALADKGQMSIINAYTFTVSLTKDLTYSQISGLNPKQTKPMGTVTTDLTTNTVESRLIIDNRDVTADYNLKGIAITGVYGTDNYVLGIINTNETTLVPAYNGQSAQTINLDVSFAISDTSIVTVNTQYAGMLTVADYIALQKYIDQRDAKKADDTAAVHKTGNETINDIKTFLKTIVGSVSGNSGTSDRVNTLAINADVALSSLSNGVYLSTNASKTTSDKPTGAAETYVFVKESNVERFTDISNGQSYFRVKNGSTYTAWNRFSTAAELAAVDSEAVHKSGNETIGGVKKFTSAIDGDLKGNAGTASSLKTARTLSFTGDATGSGSFDGSGNVSIKLTESATGRNDTKSSQTLSAGNAVTMIDGVTTNESGEVTGVNLKSAKLPATYPPNNDSDLVHKSGNETISGVKSFSSAVDANLSGNAATATKLKTARKLNGQVFDGTEDIHIDPEVKTLTTNVDLFSLDSGYYYYSGVSATNKPSGSSNYFTVLVLQASNDKNGFMQVVDSNNNAWWTSESNATWNKTWKPISNDDLIAHLDGAETLSGRKTFKDVTTFESDVVTPRLRLRDSSPLLVMNSGDGDYTVLTMGSVAGSNYSRTPMLNGDGSAWLAAGEGARQTWADYIANGSVSGTKLSDISANSENTVIVSDSGYAYIVVGAQSYQNGDYDGISVWKLGSTYLTNPKGNYLADDTEVVHNSGNESVSGVKTFSSAIKANGGVTGNASTASKWSSNINFKLTGDVSGSVSFDGSGNVSMDTSGSDLVHKSTKETISGIKTFDENIYMNKAIVVQNADNSNSGYYFSSSDVSGNTRFIETRADIGNTSGNMGFALGAGGLTIVGGGESGRAFLAALASGSLPGLVSVGSGGTEHAMLISDSEVYIGTGYQDGGTSGKWWNFKTDGTIVNPAGHELLANNETAIISSLKVNGATDMPVITKEVTASGLTFKFRRTGNFVDLEVSGTYTGILSTSWDADVTSITTPAGFIPDNWRINFPATYGSGTGFLSYYSPNGSSAAKITNRNLPDNHTNKFITANASWITSDPWPN